MHINIGMVSFMLIIVFSIYCLVWHFLKMWHYLNYYYIFKSGLMLQFWHWANIFLFDYLSEASFIWCSSSQLKRTLKNFKYYNVCCKICKNDFRMSTFEFSENTASILKSFNFLEIS